MPARLADGLGLESGLGPRRREPFAPSHLWEFGSPASGFWSNPDLGCNEVIQAKPDGFVNFWDNECGAVEWFGKNIS
jgi:hypothetical protein